MELLFLIEVHCSAWHTASRTLSRFG